jgi:hypothetical protein
MVLIERMLVPGPEDELKPNEGLSGSKVYTRHQDRSTEQTGLLDEKVGSDAGMEWRLGPGHEHAIHIGSKKGLIVI